MRTASKSITYEDLARLFDKPLVDAAAELGKSNASTNIIGISDTCLKSVCRTLNIHAWPYRRLESLRNRLAIIESKSSNRTAKQDEINAISAEVARILRTGEKDSDTTKYGRGVRKKSSERRFSAATKQEKPLSPTFPQADNLIFEFKVDSVEEAQIELPAQQKAPPVEVTSQKSNPPFSLPLGLYLDVDAVAQCLNVTHCTF
jgi:hypothetical protein